MNKSKPFSFLLLVFLMSSSWSFSMPQHDKKDFSERVKISLREVGHQLLLAGDDSISLVLPIKELSKSKYRIAFEKQFLFKPNTLINNLKAVVEKTDLPKNYRVEVISCSTKEIAYSYEINVDETKTIIPCLGRYLPKDCYFIEVNFLQESPNTYTYVFFIIIITLLILGLFYKKIIPKKDSKIRGVVKNEKAIALGSFQFYPEHHKLVKKAFEISLSKKECELLEIFVANKNQIVTREDLTKQVWEDKGVFIGRSLDTFISKLRKKLIEDDSIKITNVHGVGYKLEVNY